MEERTILEKNLTESIRLKKELLSDQQMISIIADISEEITRRYSENAKVFFCGNGGSAADAQHLAAEFSGRYYYDRPPLFAEALHVNTSYITAVANDYSFDDVYSRLINAFGSKNDVLIALSTSGNSKNVVNAVKKAKEMDLLTIGFSGESGGQMKAFCDYNVLIPSTDTARIQECHMLIGHSICEKVESNLFPK